MLVFCQRHGLKIRIRIARADPERGEQNQCGSKRIWIRFWNTALNNEKQAFFIAEYHQSSATLCLHGIYPWQTLKMMLFSTQFRSWEGGRRVRELYRELATKFGFGQDPSSWTQVWVGFLKHIIYFFVGFSVLLWLRPLRFPLRCC